MIRYILTLFILGICCFNLNAQTAITEINATYEEITDASDNYTEDGVNYNFNVGSDNNLILNNIEIGSETFVPLRFADRIEIIRVDNPVVSGNKQLMFYEEENFDGDVVDIKPSFKNTMEEVLLSSVVNRGTDNVFGNQGDGSGNNNNIQRIDFIFDDGLGVPADAVNEGFTILERGGNDAFKIAPILSLNPDGTAASFGNVVSVGTGDWGGSSIDIVTTVMSSPTPGDPLERTTTVGSQNVQGVLITYEQLGLIEDDLFFGYALAGGDATTDGDNWTDVENEDFFPRDTDSSSGNEGGLDLIAGGAIFTNNATSPTIELTEGTCWRTLTSPVEESYEEFFARFRTDGTDYGGLWTQGVPDGARTTFGEPNVFTLDEDGSEWVVVEDLSEAIPAGTGFLISIFDRDEFENPASEGFPKTADNFDTDPERQAPVTVNLGTSIGTTDTGGDNDPNFQGFSMLGNPYKSAINFNSLNRTEVQEIAWIYDRNTSGWISWNGTSGDITNGVIAPGQGFVVQNVESPSNPSIEFPESAKTTGSNFFGKQADQPDFVRLEIEGEELYSSMWLEFTGSGSITNTNGDVIQLMPFEENYAILSSIKEGSLYDIGRYPSLYEEVDIPVVAQVTRPGSYTLRATDMEIPMGAELYLRDLETGNTIALEHGMEYTFTISQATKALETGCFSTPRKARVSVSNRFVITSNKPGDENDNLPSQYNLKQNYPNPFNPATQITYELPQASEVRLEVFDMSGRQVASIVNERVSAGTHTANFDASRLSSGVYLYRLQAGSVVLTRKLTLIK